jgi:hypothetical protein
VLFCHYAAYGRRLADAINGEEEEAEEEAEVPPAPAGGFHPLHLRAMSVEARMLGGLPVREEKGGAGRGSRL